MTFKYPESLYKGNINTGICLLGLGFLLFIFFVIHLFKSVLVLHLLSFLGCLVAFIAGIPKIIDGLKFQSISYEIDYSGFKIIHPHGVKTVIKWEDIKGFNERQKKIQILTSRGQEEVSKALENFQEFYESFQKYTGTRESQMPLKSGQEKGSSTPLTSPAGSKSSTAAAKTAPSGAKQSQAAAKPAPVASKQSDVTAVPVTTGKPHPETIRPSIEPSGSTKMLREKDSAQKPAEEHKEDLLKARKEKEAMVKEIFSTKPETARNKIDAKHEELYETGSTGRKTPQKPSWIEIMQTEEARKRPATGPNAGPEIREEPINELVTPDVREEIGTASPLPRPVVIIPSLERLSLGISGRQSGEEPLPDKQKEEIQKESHGERELPGKDNHPAALELTEKKPESTIEKKQKKSKLFEKKLELPRKKQNRETETRSQISEATAETDVPYMFGIPEPAYPESLDQKKRASNTTQTPSPELTQSAATKWLPGSAETKETSQMKSPAHFPPQGEKIEVEAFIRQYAQMIDAAGKSKEPQAKNLGDLFGSPSEASGLIPAQKHSFTSDYIPSGPAPSDDLESFPTKKLIETKAGDSPTVESMFRKLAKYLRRITREEAKNLSEKPGDGSRE